MSHVPNDLAELFPDDATALHALKTGGDMRFPTLADRYHDLNRAIHRAESDIEPTSDDHLEEMKKARLAILDEIGIIIAAHRAG